MAYLTEVLNAAPAVANVAAYGQTIHEKWRIRQLILTCQRVTAQGYAGYGEAQEFIDGAEQAVYEIARTRESSSVHTLRDVMQETFQPHRRRRPSAAPASPASRRASTATTG